MESSNGIFEWNLRMESSNGIIEWNHRLESSNGNVVRNRRLESAIGIFEWKIVVVLSLETWYSSPHS